MKKNYLPRLSILLLGLTLVFTGCKKEGCIDPSASNFDPDAKKDNGSCTYATAEGTKIISDDGSGTGTVTWYKDTVYTLQGFVFVNSGQTLTIEAGTVIKGAPGTGADASALIVAKGGKINAAGTDSNPIIFTAAQDDPDNISDIPVGTRGLWGGVIILGAAGLNSTPGVSNIEGIPLTEARGEYGGTNNSDNSGTFQYVSIRYGGSDIGSGNEINGLTLGGVGSGTTIDHIEVVYNADDGVEFFGGTVNTKYMATVFCGDDNYDYDEGFRGKGQFWFNLQGSDDGDRGGEHDGGTTPEDGAPYATPRIYNATYIGRGESAGKRALTFRDNAGGEYHNSIFIEWGKGVDLELLSSGEHSWKRLADGELKLEDNVFYNVAGNTAADVFTISLGAGVSMGDSTTAVDSIPNYFTIAGNTVTDPQISVSYSADGGLNPVPANSAMMSGATAPTDSWYEQVTYKGAFGSNWLDGWSFLSTHGYLQ